MGREEKDYTTKKKKMLAVELVIDVMELNTEKDFRLGDVDLLN